MKILAALLSLFRPTHDDAVLDHVPVKIDGNVAAKKLARARREAAKRHGKTFHTHERKPRETEPSMALKALNEASAPASVIMLPESNVSTLRTGTK